MPLFAQSSSDLSTASKQTEYDLSVVNRALLPMLGVGAIGALWVGISSDEAGAIGAVMLWALACLAVGAVVGFLFGIPRSGISITRGSTKSPLPNTAVMQGAATSDPSSTAKTPSDAVARPNTNLEEISDWLTKIIVGLGLVNLKGIGVRVQEIATNAASSLYDIPSAWEVSVAMALIIGFTVVGFLCGYLYTRLFVQGALTRSDHNMVNLRQELNAAFQKAPPIPDAEVDPTRPSIPSESDKETARRLNQIASVADRPEVVLEQVRTLASEYETIRQQQGYSNSRTRKMREVAGRMKLIGLMVQSYMPKLTASPSPGERLVAIMALQMRFDPVYIEWLANRLVEEPAFPAYQAASALLARLPLVGQAEAERIRHAARAAVDERVRLNLAPEKTRDNLFDEIVRFGSAPEHSERTPDSSGPER